jgi:tRNA threonylcarbamoyladenosine biosynthesis protein TsaB
MTILAVDTATEGCSAALLSSERLLERFVELERGHSDRILGMVDELLGEASVKLRDLAAIAFGRGPGAFTGVRLAAAVAQGLAYGAGLKVVPVSDLRAVAQQVFDVVPDAGSVLVCNDARMKEVYWACFVRGKDRLASAATVERVSAPDSVDLPAGLPGAVHGAGRGFRAYPQLAARLAPAIASFHPTLLPRAREIAHIGRVEHATGRSLPPEQAVPVYVRDDVARPAPRH